MAEPIENLRGRVDDLTAEIRSLADAEDITPEQDARLDEALGELDEARSELAQAEARADRLAKFRETDNAPVVHNERTISAPNVNKRTDPFDLDELRSAAPEKRVREVRARAIDIVENSRGGYRIDDAAAEDLTRKLNGRSRVARDIAEMVVHTGSEEYRDAFEAVLRDPADIAAMSEFQARQRELLSRAAIQTSGVSGALHIPYQLDPTVILTNAGVVDPMRSLARIEQITGTDQWSPNTSAGITAGYVGESASFSDNTPTFASNAIQTYKAGAFAFGSYESLSDSGAADELGVMFADAKANWEGGEFATGTGSSAIQGVVVFASNATSVVAGSSGDANAADLVAADIYAVRAGLSPRWRKSAVWMGSLQTAHTIRQLGTANNYHALTLDLTQADPPTLLGRSFYENSSMDTTIVSGSTDFVLLHGDFKQYVIVDRVGMVMQYQPVVTSGSKFPTGESAWHVYWRVGGGGLVADAFRLLKL